MLTVGSRPRAVLFDLYGTLIDVHIDTQPFTIWEQLSRYLVQNRVQLSPAELRDRYHKQVDSDRREHGEPFVLNGTFFADVLGADARLSDDQVAQFARRFRELTTRSLKLRHYALPLIHELRRNNCRIGIVSNTDAALTAHDLDELRIRHLFDAVVLSSEVGVKKPDPTIFNIAIERLGVSAAETIHIGDDYTADFLGAVNARVRPILLCSNGSRLCRDCVRASLHDILSALDELGLNESAA